MDTHPLVNHEIARLRTEERVSRGLTAYRALRVREEQVSNARLAQAPSGSRLLNRLVRRTRTAGRAARTVGGSALPLERGQ